MTLRQLKDFRAFTMEVILIYWSSEVKKFGIIRTEGIGGYLNLLVFLSLNIWRHSDRMTLRQLNDIRAFTM